MNKPEVDSKAVDMYMSKLDINPTADNNGLEIKVKSPEDMVCDFCGAVNLPLVKNPAGHVEIAPDTFSADEWMSCPFCTPLIQQNERNALRDRAIEAYNKIIFDPEYVKMMVTQAHDAFWSARTQDGLG